MDNKRDEVLQLSRHTLRKMSRRLKRSQLGRLVTGSADFPVKLDSNKYLGQGLDAYSKNKPLKSDEWARIAHRDGDKATALGLSRAATIPLISII
jgi:hypothetical protein